MVDGLADRVDATETDAWIAALLREASAIAGTVRIHYTFRINADRHVVLYYAITVALARTWVARVDFWKDIS